jgi:geranylgeranyl diphosphate synthase type II
MAKLEDVKELVNKRLELLVAEDRSSPAKSLYEAARYALFSGGKRFRPILTLITAEIFGASLESAVDPACALELVHTYSLIHDDLPCMDDDDLRRGKPTLHKVYTEGHAVLTGDFLMTRAFEVIALSSVSEGQKVALMKILALRTGSEGMVGGQAVDLLFKGRPFEHAILDFMHRKKTAALIAASLEFGGVVAGVSAQDQVLLGKIGEHFGMAFQLLDDLSDAGEKGCSSFQLYSKHEIEKRIEQEISQAKESISRLSKPGLGLLDAFDASCMQFR